MYKIIASTPVGFESYSFGQWKTDSSDLKESISSDLTENIIKWDLADLSTTLFTNQIDVDTFIAICQKSLCKTKIGID